MDVSVDYSLESFAEHFRLFARVDECDSVDQACRLLVVQMLYLNQCDDWF